MISAEEIAEEIRRDSERGYCCHGVESQLLSSRL